MAMLEILKRDPWTRKQEAYRDLAVLAEERAGRACSPEVQILLAHMASTWRQLDEAAELILAFTRESISQPPPGRQLHNSEQASGHVPPIP